MRYLVTGGAGFIGSHIVERLLSAAGGSAPGGKDGHFVRVLDNFSSGKRENLSFVTQKGLSPTNMKGLSPQLANQLETKGTVPEVSHEVLNIACGNDQSILDLVATLNKIMGKSIKPTFTPPRPGDVFRTMADISKAKELLGYEPKVGFEEGLRKTVKFFKTYHANSNAGLEGGFKGKKEIDRLLKRKKNDFLAFIIE